MTTLPRRRHQRTQTLVVDIFTIAGVAAVYVLVVLGGGLLVGLTDSPSLALSVLATAIVAWGLEPGRTALQRLTARWFGGGRRSPYEMLSGFSESVVTQPGADQVTSPPADVSTRMARLLAEATGAAWAQVWLEIEGRSELSATWPPITESAPPVVTGIGSWVRTQEVVLDGERLGVLRLCERADQPLGSIEERLFSGLAGQAGMVLHRARLQRELARRAEELEVRAAELTRSRERVVGAQDAERRRLERDIHDGAQQHLVALVVNLRLAQSLATRSPERARAVLDDQVTAIDTAIATLGDLSRGLYPPALAAGGVAVALRGLVPAASVPIEVTDDGIGRASDEVEAALYFCAAEAVQNAVKHAAASRVAVDLARDADVLHLTVRDDGVGFDPRVGAPTRGLGNMRDRIDAVGGSLELRTSHGHGVEVLVTVPVAGPVAGPVARSAAPRAGSA